MRSLSESLLVAGFVVALTLFGLARPALAAETDSSDLVLITEDKVVETDLYAVANRVIIRGKVDGDLIAIAGQDVRVEGEVTGSVIAISAEVVVTGSIGKSLRTAAPSVVVEGSIGGDVVALAGSLQIAPRGSVANDVVLWAWNGSLLGDIGGGLEGSQRNLSLAGTILDDVAVAVRHLEIANQLVVGGDLDYRSRFTADGLDRADVGGAVVRQEPTPANIRLRALGLVGRIIVALTISALALLVAWGWPDRTQRALDRLKTAPWSSFAVGLLVFSSPLLVVVLAVLILNLAPTSAALPLVGAMIPLFLALLGLVFVLALVAGIPVAAWFGSLLRRRVTIAGAVGLGAAVVALLWLLPVVGWITAVVVLSGGLGAWVNSFRVEESPKQVEATSSGAVSSD